MGGNFSAVATLFLTQVSPTDRRASTPTHRRDRNTDHRPGARKPQLPSQPPRRLSQHLYTWPRCPLTATPADGRRSPRRAAPPAAAL